MLNKSDKGKTMSNENETILSQVDPMKVEKIRKAFGNVEYWMIGGEHEETINTPAENGIVGSGKTFKRRRIMNQAINRHPAFHATMMLAQYPSYVIIFAMPISKLQYELLAGPSPAEEEAHAIAKKVQDEIAAAKSDPPNQSN